MPIHPHIGAVGFKFIMTMLAEATVDLFGANPHFRGQRYHAFLLNLREAVTFPVDRPKNSGVDGRPIAVYPRFLSHD